MKDTASDVNAAYLQHFGALSPGERLTMVADMFETAKALMMAGIRAERPDLSPRDLRVEMFRRLYWNDFDETTFARLVERLRAN